MEAARYPESSDHANPPSMSRLAGSRVKELREARAWTQAHLAEVAGVSSRTIQRAERGDVGMETLLALANAFEIDVEELTRGTRGAKLDSAEAHEISDAYARRFTELKSPPLGVLVRPLLSDGSDALDTLAAHLAARKNVVLAGAHGTGKTLLTQRLAVDLLQERLLPIWACARYFEGDLEVWLARAAAPFTDRLAEDLFVAAEILGARVCLFVDGFNECPASHLEELASSLQALLLRSPVAVVITGHEPPPPVPELHAVLLELAPYSREQKAAVLGAHGFCGPSGSMDTLVGALATPLEISLAARCATDVTHEMTPYHVFHAYVRRLLSTVDADPAAFRALIAVADEMDRRLRQSLPVADFSAVVDRTTRGFRDVPSLPQTLIGTPLIEVEHEQCAFKHELFLHYFRAESLLRSFPAVRALADELNKPRNRSVRPFALQAYTSHDDGGAEFLSAVADEVLIAECASGVHGATLVDLVRYHANAVLDQAINAAPEISIRANPDPSGQQLSRFASQRTWTTHEKRLFSWIGSRLPLGEYLSDVLFLARQVDTVIERLISSAIAEQRGDLLSLAFRDNYVCMPGDDSFPITFIVAGLRLTHAVVCGQPDVDVLISATENCEKLGPGALYLCTESLKKTFMLADKAQKRELLPLIEPLVRACWKRPEYNLCLCAAELPQLAATADDQALRASMIALTDSLLTTDNPFLNSALVETLDCFGVLEAPMTVDDVSEQIQTILRTPDSAEHQAFAYTIYSNQLEDVIGLPHMEAIGSLSAQQRVLLLAMAALGAPDYSFSPEWILKDLAESPDIGGTLAIAAFEKYALPPAPDQYAPDAIARAFIWAHLGLARVDGPPFTLSRPLRPLESAWLALAHLLHALDSGSPESEPVVRAWSTLQVAGPAIAADPLRWVTRATRDIDRFPSILATWSDDARAFLESALAQLDSLQTCFRFGGDDLRLFVVDALGDVGDAQTRRLLAGFVDSPGLGKSAIASITRIDQRTTLS